MKQEKSNQKQQPHQINPLIIPNNKQQSSSFYSIESISTSSSTTSSSNKSELRRPYYNNTTDEEESDEHNNDQDNLKRKARGHQRRRSSSKYNRNGEGPSLFVCCLVILLIGGGCVLGAWVLWGSNGNEEIVEINTSPIHTTTAPTTSPPATIHQSSSSSRSSSTNNNKIISEYINLYKLPPPLDNDDLNESNSSITHHYYNTGVFRPPNSKLWDPHPQYIFHAFQKRFHLVLNQMTRTHSFILPGFKVTTHRSDRERAESWVERGGKGGEREDRTGGELIEGCFYNGYVLGDLGSSVAVSLCSGMTGHIRTSTGSYFIEPHHTHNQHRRDPSADELTHEIYQFVSSQQQEYEDDHTTTTTTTTPPPTTTVPHTPPSTHNYHHNQNLQIDDYYSDEDYEEEESDEEYDYHPIIPPPHQQQYHSRTKRSLSTERFVELTVVTDQTMWNYHGDNLKHYVLTLLSIVALVYRDASIGNPVNIILVNFHVLTDTDFSVNNATTSSATHGTSASEMLRNFCKWQKEHNHPDDRHPLHHDTALLLTRETICRNPWAGKCDTLGLAELGTMCDHYASCAIVQDNGLSAAFTIAHELGHVLNMPHDDDAKCSGFVSSSGGGSSSSSEEAAAVNKIQHFVMSRMLDHNTYPWAWSRCSRHFLTEFLDAGHGYCLEDRPHSNLLYGDDAENAVDNDNTLSGSGGGGGVFQQQPGEIFSEHKQCELVFGPNSQLCSYMPPCRRLWCTNHNGPESEESEGCRTQHMPWADGTRCGQNKWCQRGACVLKDLEKLRVVNGDWGSWQEYGECSRSCGGGVKRSFRECDNPKPRNGGRYCVGPRVRYESCNTFECLGGGLGGLAGRNSSSGFDFRASQCGTYDGDNFNIHGLPEDVVWVPKYNLSPKDRCKLFCRVQGSSSYYLLKEKVIDGTTCGIDTFDVCVNGACLPAGCDRKLHSTKSLDICGTCGGNSSTCTTTQGSYNTSSYGYNTVFIIPPGASNIDIRQRSYSNTARDDNYLSLYDPTTNEYVLNGHFVVSMFRKTIHFGSTILEYSGSDQIVERINSSSRGMKRGLEVRVLSVGKLREPDISYQYVISTHNDDDGDGSNVTYEWVGKRTTPSCSSVCDGMTLPFTTFDCMIRSADNSYTISAQTDCSGVAKPQHFPTPCNTHCVLSYKLSCPESCVNANNHTVECIRTLLATNVSQKVSERYCVSGGVKRPSPGPDCLSECRNRRPKWRWTQWSECGGGSSNGGSRCGNGTITSYQMRNVWCQRFNWRSLVDSSADNYEVVDDRECDGEKPAVRRVCKERGSGGGGVLCGEWGVQDWSPCSTTCGPGRIRALYACVLKTHSQTQILPKDYCTHSPKPVIERPCEQIPCASFTPTSDWSDCDCKTNTESRNITCLINGQPSDPISCTNVLQIPEPEKTRACASNNCESFSYKTSDWTRDCRLFNGKYYRYRVVSCEAEQVGRECSGQRPESMLECGEWRIESGWGGCNGSCSVGVEVRSVGCYVAGVKGSDSDCDGVVGVGGSKPAITRKCYHNCGGSSGSGGVRSLRMGNEGVGGGVNSTNNPYYYYNIENNKKLSYKWVTGVWGKCTRMTTPKSSSSSCPHPSTTTPIDFKKHRQVKCVAESSSATSSRRPSSSSLSSTPVPIAYCTSTPQPPPSTNCTTAELSELKPCPIWAISSEWSGCVIDVDAEENCGSGNTQTSDIVHGFKRRQVACVMDTNGTIMRDSSCSSNGMSPKPDDVEKCVKRRAVGESGNNMICNYNHEWKVGNWTQCVIGDTDGGKSCGGKGRKRRVVECVRKWRGVVFGVVDDDYCGKQQQRRGRMGRVERRNMMVVVRGGGSGSNKPKSVRECSRACKTSKGVAGASSNLLFKWVVGDWSECSRPCGGYGLRSRSVSCHRSNNYDWTDPDPLPTQIPSASNNSTAQQRYCSAPKPKEYDYCLVRESCESLSNSTENTEEPPSISLKSSSYEWTTTNYSKCACDDTTNLTSPYVSFQKRKVFCVSSSNKSIKAPARFCTNLTKPKRKRKCECNAHEDCGAVRDALVRSEIGVRDGEYLLKVGGKLGVRVYCYGMTEKGGTKPREYVSLSNEDSNFSEIYDKRLIRPESCPRNGTRMGSCECVMDRNRRVGVTRWGKIRVNVTSLVVDVDDFTFSTSSQDQIQYGTAGDCYSSSMICPQGRFSIDLRGTGFSVSHLATWANTGHRATMKVLRKGGSNPSSTSSLVIQGKCGGYCGSCGISKSIGLRVDVV